MTPSPAQDFALSDIAARARDLSDWTATIFGFGETAWREYRSAAWYVDLLRAELDMLKRAFRRHCVETVA